MKQICSELVTVFAVELSLSVNGMNELQTDSQIWENVLGSHDIMYK